MKNALPGVIIAISVGCSGTWGAPTHPGAPAWHHQTLDTMFVAGVALTACDSAGTIWMSHGGRYDRISPLKDNSTLAESDPLLGQAPSRLLLGAAAIGTAVVDWLILRSEVVPGWLKATWLSGVIVVEGTMNVQNNRFGTGVCGVAGTNSAGFVDRKTGIRY